MASKWAQEERRRRKAVRAAQPSEFDLEILELMRPLRHLCGGCELLDNPRANALHALWLEIENTAAVLTGNPEFYWHTRNGQTSVPSAD